MILQKDVQTNTVCSFPLGKGAELSTFVYITHSPGLRWGDFSNTGQSKIPRIIGQLALDGSNKVLMQANQQNIKNDGCGTSSTVTADGDTVRHSRKLLREEI